MPERIRADQVAGPLLGVLRAANLNTTADQNIVISAKRYVVRRVVFTNATAVIVAAVGGVFTAPGQGGSAIASNQSLAALTSSSVFMDAILGVPTTTDTFTNAGLYLTLSVPQGSPATADVYIFGDAVEP